MYSDAGSHCLFREDTSGARISIHLDLLILPWYREESFVAIHRDILERREHTISLQKMYEYHQCSLLFLSPRSNITSNIITKYFVSLSLPKTEFRFQSYLMNHDVRTSSTRLFASGRSSGQNLVLTRGSDSEQQDGCYFQYGKLLDISRLHHHLIRTFSALGRTET